MRTGNLRVGAGKVDITPADLTALNPIGGGTFTGVHDPIFLRALVLSDGESEIAVVAADLIEVGDMTAVRARIERELGIPADHLWITATHDHSAPRLGQVSPGALAHGGGPESAAYTETVYDRIVDVLRQARAAAQPARFGVSRGAVDVNVNRDVYRDGRWELGFNPGGPSDKTVWVLTFQTPDGAPIAVLMNYAVHSTVTLWSGELSGDLAGAAARHVEDELGGDVVALWTCGALGDQNPRVSFEQDRISPWAAMHAQALMVGAEVVRVVRDTERFTAGVRLRAAERVLTCPVKRGVDVMDSMTQADVGSVELRLSLLLINQVALGGVSGEVNTAIGRRLREESPLATTILTSLVNDRIGYLAEDEAFDRATHSVNGCPVARGHAEEGIVRGLSDMITAETGDAALTSSAR